MISRYFYNILDVYICLFTCIPFRPRQIPGCVDCGRAKGMDSGNVNASTQLRARPAQTRPRRERRSADCTPTHSRPNAHGERTLWLRRIRSESSRRVCSTRRSASEGRPGRETPACETHACAGACGPHSASVGLDPTPRGVGHAAAGRQPREARSAVAERRPTVYVAAPALAYLAA